ncbi:CidA/LrgA family protein [Acuticoccus yangtzensis]|uniref:CidA/LrgA family protein n=1 Tax=Acuticoccus yangtzensis TaxID=1443441 RepID=UPI0009499BCD|nr:CidA/LrgA family protein [Acuticoccus yangtzensis]ORE94331.1 LrgA family protein [Stappia sp. 22II-S9-Z10]
MINAIALLLGCQLIGEIIVRLVGLPVPGPVVGAALLCAGLLVRRRVSPTLDTTARTILSNLSLLFVPAAVGVVEHRELFLTHGFALVAALVVSTVMALAAAALAFRWVAGE